MTSKVKLCFSFCVTRPCHKISMICHYHLSLSKCIQEKPHILFSMCGMMYPGWTILVLTWYSRRTIPSTREDLKPLCRLRISEAEIIRTLHALKNTFTLHFFSSNLRRKLMLKKFTRFITSVGICRSVY